MIVVDCDLERSQLFLVFPDGDTQDVSLDAVRKQFSDILNGLDDRCFFYTTFAVYHFMTEGNTDD